MTYKNILDLFYYFRSQHPILSGTTISWGNLSDYSREDYITKYPAIHFVPQPSILAPTSNDFVWSIMIYDLLNEYVGDDTRSNQIYAISQCHEILQDFYAWFANNLTDYGYFILAPIQYSVFVDRFNQSVAGVEAQITIQVEQLACLPPFIPSPTPTTTSTPTPTPTATPCQVVNPLLQVMVVVCDDSDFSVELQTTNTNQYQSPGDIDVNMTWFLDDGSTFDYTIGIETNESLVNITYSGLTSGREITGYTMNSITNVPPCWTIYPTNRWIQRRCDNDAIFNSPAVIPTGFENLIWTAGIYETCVYMDGRFYGDDGYGQHLVDIVADTSYPTCNDCLIVGTQTPTPTPTYTPTLTPTPTEPITNYLLAETGEILQAENNDLIEYD